MESLPTPPNEDHLKPQSFKRPHSGSKTVKTVHRVSKRASTHGHPPSPSTDSHSHSVGDGRHKRVWKACERCRMKKTKVRHHILIISPTFTLVLIETLSVMESFLVRGVRTMGWSALLARGKRPSTSNYREGMLFPPLSTWKLSSTRNSHLMNLSDTQKCSRTRSLP